MAKTNRKLISAKNLRTRLNAIEKSMAQEKALATAYREELESAFTPDTEVVEPILKDLDADYYADADLSMGIETSPAFLPVPILTLAILTKEREVKRVNEREWAAWFAKSKQRLVAFNEVDRVGVTTIFVGINHGAPPGKPLWFETIIAGGELDGHVERHTTWEEALQGHNTAVELLRSAMVTMRLQVTRVERERRDNRV